MAEKLLIDKYCTCGGEIYKKNGVLFACTLNQTDITSNKNKFYIIQLLKNNDTLYNLFIRYGRIGENGKSSYERFSDEFSACASFKSQFKKKTGNNWGEPFKQKKDKYFMTTIDISDVPVPEIKEIKEIESKLDVRVQYLIKLLSNKDMMNKSLISLNMDTKKMPLGKISKVQINQARELLKKINDSQQNELANLSSQFYTLIPYSVGRNTPPIIDNKEIMEKFISLLDELEHIAVTTSVIESKSNDDINKLDKIYDEMDATIGPIEKDSRIWQVINDYIKVADTHNYDIELIDAYRITREGEEEIFDEHCKDIGNHMLLWHGSGLSNWLSIVKNGFRLPNTLKGVVLTGWMFGPGTYFSNMFSKSFGYTRYHDFDNYACLLLAEVALGKQHKITSADYNLNQEEMDKLGCNSTYGMGKTTTKVKYEINDGVMVPAGNIETRNGIHNLLYDEFIVYNTKQIKHKYMVIVRNKY